jgi:hypothetical protein
MRVRRANEHRVQRARDDVVVGKFALTLYQPPVFPAR